MDSSHLVATNEEFKSFVKLPIELRLEVWRFSFPGSRRLEIQERYNPWAICGRQTGAIVSAKSHVPLVTLYINQESRKETQKHYRLLFHKNNREIILPKLEYGNFSD